MITLWELKNQDFCKQSLKVPFYIKNLFLLFILSIILSFVYLMYFRRNGMYVLNIQRILKGLNSNTFNNLVIKSEPLRLTRLLNNYQAQISTNQFMDDCLRINKPCKFEGLAKTWSAYENWRFTIDEGYSYLEEVFEDQQVDVYLDLDADEQITYSSLAKNSFKPDSLTKMKYKDFLKKQSGDEVQVTIRDSSDYITDLLLEDITEPSFYADFADLDKLVLYQGQTFVNPPGYINQEQVLCSLDGYLQVKLIPHIYRQEVYAGKDRIIVDSDASAGKEEIVEKIEPNRSPINFFDPDLDNYPLFQEIQRKYTVLLHEGDCLFIPAFYFYQFASKPGTEDKTDAGIKPSTLAVSLVYESNSALLQAFFGAIENNILT